MVVVDAAVVDVAVALDVAVAVATKDLVLLLDGGCLVLLAPRLFDAMLFVVVMFVVVMFVVVG